MNSELWTFTPVASAHPGPVDPRLKKTAILKELEELLADETAGDPISGVKWSRKNPRTLSVELKARGVEACANTVAATLREQHYSLRVNRKSIAATHHPDRDQQFRHLATVKQDFLDRGVPVISVDSKKRELVGAFRNQGRAWRREPHDVLIHDFRSNAQGVALPYGIYDLARNHGTVIVGTSHDTAAFAVDSIGLWLESTGWSTYPGMSELLILCDAGGSNGYRTRLWKYALSQLVSEHGISVTVGHYPPGASKWNPADHRLFSFISLNWAGVPLRDYETILNYLRTTSTRSGLIVDASLHTQPYATGVEVTNAQMEQIHIARDDTLPLLNYTISA